MDKSLVENLEIKNVVLMDTDQAANVYMERLFPLWTSVIVVSLEGKYPLDPDLREATFNLLKTNSNLNVFTFGANSDKFVTASQRRLTMHFIFSLDVRRYPWQKPVFEFDEFKITELFRAFASSGDNERLQSYNLYYDVMMPDSVKWYHELLKS